MKNNKPFIVIAVVLLCISVALVLYPTASEMINKMFDNNSIIQYNNQVSALDANTKSNMINDAQAYNYNLSNVVTVVDSFSPDAFNVDESYENILSVTDDGLMGSVSIPEINCNLPIYHGISESILDKGAVHMANTSFPVGGESTHAVVSAHTAYPGKEFFNRLTELEIGDYFYINILGDTLAYRVCQINVVLPTDSQLLKIENGQDLVTLVTCTPYSINTHRLLVRGQRDLVEEARLLVDETQSADNDTQSHYVIVYVCAGVVILIIILLLVFFIRRKKRKANTDEAKD